MQGAICQIIPYLISVIRLIHHFMSIINSYETNNDVKRLKLTSWGYGRFLDFIHIRHNKSEKSGPKASGTYGGKRRRASGAEGLMETRKGQDGWSGWNLLKPKLSASDKEHHRTRCKVATVAPQPPASGGASEKEATRRWRFNMLCTLFLRTPPPLPWMIRTERIPFSTQASR